MAGEKLKESVWGTLTSLNGTDPKGYNVGFVRRKVNEGKQAGHPIATLGEVDKALQELAAEGLLVKAEYRHRFTEAGHVKAGIVPAHAS